MDKRNAVMMQDVLAIAYQVAEDLGLHSAPSLDRCFYLCERHGGAARLVHLPPYLLGRCYRDEDRRGCIDIALGLPDPQASAVAVHELTHRLCTCSERYEHFNRARYAAYPYEQFHELIAIAVERVYQVARKAQQA